MSLKKNSRTGAQLLLNSGYRSTKTHSWNVPGASEHPEKQWKITDEDWRNREKWDAYEVAVDEMLQKTNTSFAPWHVLESVDKKYARIKALKIVIDEIEKALNRQDHIGVHIGVRPNVVNLSPEC